MTNLNVTVTPTPTVTASLTDKLEERLSEWIEKMKSFDSEYFAITAEKGKLYYVSGKSATEPLSFDILIDRGSGFERTLSYRKDNASSAVLHTPFLIIVKKNKRLIANDHGEIFGFGFKDGADSKVKSLLIHFQIASTHMLITASDKATFIDVSYSLTEDSAIDPFGKCLHALFDSVDHARKEGQ